MMQKLYGQQDSSNVQGYDAETVRRVLARASQLESQEPERISAEHIEALGEEIGLSPQAVRRALQEIDPQVRANANALTTRNLINTCKPGLQWALAVFVMLKLAIQFGFGHSQDQPAFLVVIITSILFVLPFVVYFYNGRKQKDVRLGMIGGGVGVLAMLVAFQLAAGGNQAVNLDSTWLAMILVGIITGGMGSAVHFKNNTLPKAVRASALDR